MKIRKIVIICVSIVLALALVLGALYGITLLGTSFNFEGTRLSFVSGDGLEYIMRDREGNTLSYMEQDGRAALTYGAYGFFIDDNLEGAERELYNKVVKSKNFYDKFGVLLNFA
ncbi:hypothetical protein FACS18949_09870 [Clostridia bacterium]|nr:hypothetical protein FACS18949_09870 [Clostridia bacterium]